MARKNKKYLFIIPVILFAVLITIMHFVPEPVNWETSFSAHRKIPYGCSALRELLKDILPGQPVDYNTASFYMTLKEDNSSDNNLIVINDEFNPDDYDLDALLNHVSKGNVLFLSTLAFPAKLCDTLGLKTNNSIFDTSYFKKFKESLNLNYFPENSKTTFSFRRRFPEHYFTHVDSGILILGSDRLSRTDFIAATFGKGKIYMHCQPMAFTNYHILYSNYEYACAALSVLPVRPTIWDQYYKPDRFVNMSPVRFILNNKSLRSAWYIITITVLFYFIFGSRRKQRPIPVIMPPANISLDFIKSIGKLYYKGQNHMDIARKKVMYLREFLRNKYGFKEIDATIENIRILTEKSGTDHEIVDEMLRRAVYVERSLDINQDELLKMNLLIERFYKYCK